MKILKKGTIPAMEWFTETCRKCKCEFAFRKDEAKFCPADAFEYFSYGYNFLKCPTCTETVHTSFSNPYNPLS